MSISGLRHVDGVAAHDRPFHVPDVRHNFARRLSDLAVPGSMLPESLFVSGGALLMTNCRCFTTPPAKRRQAMPAVARAERRANCRANCDVGSHHQRASTETAGTGCLSSA